MIWETSAIAFFGDQHFPNSIILVSFQALEGFQQASLLISPLSPLSSPTVHSYHFGESRSQMQYYRWSCLIRDMQAIYMILLSCIGSHVTAISCTSWSLQASFSPFFFSYSVVPCRRLFVLISTQWVTAINQPLRLDYWY